MYLFINKTTLKETNAVNDLLTMHGVDLRLCAICNRYTSRHAIIASNHKTHYSNMATETTTLLGFHINGTSLSKQTSIQQIHISGTRRLSSFETSVRLNSSTRALRSEHLSIRYFSNLTYGGIFTEDTCICSYCITYIKRNMDIHLTTQSHDINGAKSSFQKPKICQDLHLFHVCICLCFSRRHGYLPKHAFSCCQTNQTIINTLVVPTFLMWDWHTFGWGGRNWYGCSNFRIILQFCS